MIVVTGAAGFIGSVLVQRLNEENFKDLVLVDDFSKPGKHENYSHKQFTELVDRDEFFPWIDKNHRFIQIIIHLGARTDTTEFDRTVFERLNLNYSKYTWNACLKYGLPLIYASSAATYGNGELGNTDDHMVIPSLMPLNPYGESKNEFDKWVIVQSGTPFYWAGLKFFNVYGPNEYHKGRMASVVYHAYNQIKDTGKMRLFRSHKEGFRDGEQMRDFIYVKDVADVIMFLMKTRKTSGIFNLGTGKARTFLDLARSVFHSMDVKENIEFIDTPSDIRDKYQYFTQAEMSKLRNAGYHEPFTSLEKGVDDYVQNYLVNGSRY